MSKHISQCMCQVFLTQCKKICNAYGNPMFHITILILYSHKHKTYVLIRFNFYCLDQMNPVSYHLVFSKWMNIKIPLNTNRVCNLSFIIQLISHLCVQVTDSESNITYFLFVTFLESISGWYPTITKISADKHVKMNILFQHFGRQNCCLMKIGISAE